MNCNELAKSYSHLHNENVEDYSVNIFPEEYVCCRAELDQGCATICGGHK